MAGAAGFEPAHGGTKSRCLTAWPRPKLKESDKLPDIYNHKLKFCKGKTFI